MGRMTTTIYDADGEITEDRVNDPMGRTTTTMYDLDGEVTESIDPMGRTTTTMYDAAGEVTETIDPMGNKTTTLYDADGEVTETIDPLGHMTTTLYDADGEVTESIDPLGRMTTTLYDADGEITESIDPLGRTTTAIYDADGEVTETFDPLGHSSTTFYDADGEVTETVDPLGHSSTTFYDADGEVTETVDPLGHSSTTFYDADGEVTEVIDPLGNKTTTIHDADGEVTESIDPMGNTTTTLYDADGEVTETIDALGRTTTSFYDADGRLMSETWEDAHATVTNVESYTYDADGNLLTAGDSSGTYTMTYDALKRVITTEDPFGLTLTYTYDADGNRTQVQDSLGGATTYVYDADNELTSEQFGGTGQVPLRIDMSYDSDGEVLTETRFSDLAGTQVVVNSNDTYNADGEITSLVDRNGSGTVVASFTYTYDLDNRVLTEVNLGMTTTYTYDADSQLTSEVSPLATIDYTYDAGGNRTNDNSMIGPGNRLLSDSNWAYTYDADGNLVEKVGVSPGPDKGLTWTYTYDNRNQMTTAVEVQGSTTLASVTFTYDVFGNRIEEDASGSMLPTQVTRFAYDGQNVWADLDGSNNLVMRRLFLNTVDSVTARISASGTVAWYLVDRLGSVNVLTDSTGAVIDRITYDGYGNIISETNPSASDRYLFTGREFDRVTGLQYNRARYYDPTTGRWTTEDPLGFAAGDSNLYRYVGNDPTNHSDPTGLFDFAGVIQPVINLAIKQAINAKFPKIAQLIADLDDRQFEVREKTSNALEGYLADMADEFKSLATRVSLESALNGCPAPSLEVATRIEALLLDHKLSIRTWADKLAEPLFAVNQNGTVDAKAEKAGIEAFIKTIKDTKSIEHRQQIIALLESITANGGKINLLIQTPFNYTITRNNVRKVLDVVSPLPDGKPRMLEP